MLPEPRSNALLRGVYVVRFPIAVTAFSVLLAWTVWERFGTEISALYLSQKSTFWYNDPTRVPGYAPDLKTTVKPHSKVTFGLDDEYATTEPPKRTQTIAGSECVKRALPPHGVYEQPPASATDRRNQDQIFVHQDQSSRWQLSTGMRAPALPSSTRLERGVIPRISAGPVLRRPSHPCLHRRDACRAFPPRGVAVWHVQRGFFQA